MKKVIASFFRACFYLHRQHDAGEQKNKTESQNMKTKIEVGTWVRMTSENSNWNVGEKGRISFIGSDRVGVYFPERGDTDDDDYTAFNDAFVAL